jgi:hypothetical protein
MACKNGETYLRLLHYACSTYFRCYLHPSSEAQTAEYSCRCVWLLWCVGSWIVHWSRLRLIFPLIFGQISWPSLSQKSNSNEYFSGEDCWRIIFTRSLSCLLSYRVAGFQAGVTTVNAKQLQHTYSRECGDDKHCGLHLSERRPLLTSMLITMRPSFGCLFPCSIWRRSISKKLMSLLDLYFQ